MVLQANMRRVRKLKRVVAVAKSIHEIAQMKIHKRGLMIRVMNPDHNIPVTVNFPSTWFQTYHFMSQYCDACTFDIDMHNLTTMLNSGTDEDEAYIYVFSTPGFTRLSFLFYGPGGFLRATTDVNMARGGGIEFQWTPWWYKFWYTVVEVSMPTHPFEGLLGQSMFLYRPNDIQTMKLSVSASLVTLYVGPMRYNLRNMGVEIKNVPDGATVDIKLDLHRADYFLEVVEISDRVIFRTAYPFMIPHPWLIMIAEIDGYPSFYFHIPPSSIVLPRVE